MSDISHKKNQIAAENKQDLEGEKISLATYYPIIQLA